ncbi:MAG: DUF359 domain-containing protein [Nitrosopumilus sp. H13]|nr:MAG: DUF359 domain-containing protein [Nitrosopumilus sp. H13]
MRLPDSMRDKLQIPLGELLPDSEADGSAIKSRISGAYVVTVGDRTTEKLISLGIIPSLQIVDGLERRKKREPPDIGDAEEIRIENPPAQITRQSIDAIKAAFGAQRPVRLLVSGEEDLLVIPVCAYAPEGAVVLYGQPGEGLVIVRLTCQVRNKTAAMLDMME